MQFFQVFLSSFPSYNFSSTRTSVKMRGKNDGIGNVVENKNENEIEIEIEKTQMKIF